MSAIKVSRVFHNEGGVMSANREYLEVWRNKYVFHICATPFGKVCGD